MAKLSGIHHLKFSVSDLEASGRFYERVFGAQRLLDADHVDAQGNLYAAIYSIPDLASLLELRLNAAAAARQAGFDPVTFAVADLQELDAWMRRLDELGITHSGRLVGLQAWLVVFEDPDRRRLRLYSLEQHGSELPPSSDDRWLSED